MTDTPRTLDLSVYVGHAPTPWAVDVDPRRGMEWNRSIDSADGHTVCFMTHSDGKALDKDAANDRLIADAPKILERARELERETIRLTAERDALRDVLQLNGFVPCDIAACNCGSWHHRHGLPERWAEIKDALAEAGHPLCNENGNKPLNALGELVTECAALRTALDEANERLWLLEGKAVMMRPCQPHEEAHLNKQTNYSSAHVLELGDYDRGVSDGRVLERAACAKLARMLRFSMPDHKSADDLLEMCAEAIEQQK